MGINVKGTLGGAARVAAGAALLVAAGSAFAPAHAKKLQSLIGSATGSTGPGPLLSTYFDLGYSWGSDDVVRLTNPTASDACAMIYVFSPDEELQASCAIGLSANAETAFDVAASLTSNPAAPWPGGLVAGTIEIISSSTSDTDGPFANTAGGITCDPQTVTPITAINAYLETSVVVQSYGSWLPGATVLPFTDDGTIDQTNLNTIQTLLAAYGSDGGLSGDGKCDPNPWTAPDLAS